ncbi:hypothetical protein CD30_15915 [Ureibacillus massiliensis 4400831 = CIP 108448 = CCUG 49529]|uniref:Uncharacterized protein n=1 Tax=Ureibacillus massiliensis 4400831 = CIP 108448 = CCUG 49529 TaxID=1211035 RepID=A0A0A3IY34_9BACL|nr:hypothetical protein CD30_15915 [Ureibacillus massiliensis 4400831 = CIP 108448 = CCUG 49529]
MKFSVKRELSQIKVPKCNEVFSKKGTFTMKSAQKQCDFQGKGNFRNKKCPNTMKFSVKRELSQ